MILRCLKRLVSLTLSFEGGPIRSIIGFMNLLAVTASCFDFWSACACSTLFRRVVHCSLWSIVILLIQDRYALLHIQIGHVLEVGHLSFSYTDQGPQGIVEKLSAPSFTDGIIWDRDYFYVVPQLQGSRPKWRFAQIRPVTGRLWEVISPLPRRLSCAPMHEHWPMAPQGFRSHPPGWHETRLFSLRMGWGSITSSIAFEVVR